MQKYFLSICAVLRNESNYLSEWINFHRLQGVEHFYLYHNRDFDEDLETVNVVTTEAARWADITYSIWQGTAQQNNCYNSCLKDFGHENEWIAFIDIDEFLWSPPSHRFSDTLSGQWWKDQPGAGVAAVAVHWLLFGSNYQKEKQDGLVIDRFTRRAGSVNSHVKSICRPKHTVSFGRDPHSILPEKGFSVVDERGLVLPSNYACSTTGTADILRINHYHTKSYGEFFSRKLGGRDANSGRSYTAERVEEMFRAHDCNEVEDTGLKDLYGERLREILHCETTAATWDA